MPTQAISKALEIFCSLAHQRPAGFGGRARGRGTLNRRQQSRKIHHITHGLPPTPVRKQRCRGYQRSEPSGEHTPSLVAPATSSPLGAPDVESSANRCLRTIHFRRDDVDAEHNRNHHREISDPVRRPTKTTANATPRPARLTDNGGRLPDATDTSPNPECWMIPDR